MARRTPDDGGEAQVAAPGQQNRHKAKKRKVQAAEKENEIVPDGDAAALSKEERRALRKLKKLKTESDAVVQDSPAAVQEEPSLNKKQDADARAIEKAEKKRLRNLEKKSSRTVDNNDESIAAGDVEPTISKKQRKAERARMKSIRANGASENGLMKGYASTNGVSEVYGSTELNENPNYKDEKTLLALPQHEIDAFLSSNSISITDPITTKPLRPIIAFSQLPDDAHPQPSPFSNFKAPTPIQAASWPFLLAGRDVIGVAETGSGKTLAFGVPCIRHILPLIGERSKSAGGAARAVIVSPTRELAVQSFEQMQLIAKPAGLKAVCVYGGVPKEDQRRDLKTAQIVVATPGRLVDLIDEGYAQLKNVSYLVLDEADRMLDKGFEDAIRKIVLSTSSKGTIRDVSRQTLMFTATWPPSIRELAATFMNSPVKIVIGDSSDGELRANTRIEQRVEVVEPQAKEMRLLQLLKQHQSGAARDDRILVFCLYKKEATRVEGNLRYKGFKVAAIHGDMSQDKRTASLESFKRGTTPLLVATDVAARGLDIPAVKLVLNYTFPLTTEDYVHRIGRTGRAGANGLSITLFTEHDKAQSGALINVLKAAGQPVPDALLKFGTTVKKKGHEAYGAFYKESDGMKAATKIKFDD